MFVVMEAPIGIFDSGYGGLTVMKEIVKQLPAYDFLYLGDNARAPYGPRSFDTVYQYTLECVKWFFGMNCPIVVLACNTASAKALRTIQQNDLPSLDASRRVLGVIRPTTEIIGEYTRSGHIGVLATSGTVQSNSYVIEIEKFYPGLRVTQHACPIWVPLIENNEHLTPGADYFIQKHVEALINIDPAIDTVLLACTHYPLIADRIRRFLPAGVTLISQGQIVGESLATYLQRHSALEKRVSRTGGRAFFTSDSAVDFENHASAFYGEALTAAHLSLK
jgi:glutamate racemase